MREVAQANVVYIGLVSVYSTPEAWRVIRDFWCRILWRLF